MKNEIGVVMVCRVRNYVACCFEYATDARNRISTTRFRLSTFYFGMNIMIEASWTLLASGPKKFTMICHPSMRFSQV